jgi:hypothetical protein
MKIYSTDENSKKKLIKTAIHYNGYGVSILAQFL